MKNQRDMRKNQTKRRVWAIEVKTGMPGTRRQWVLLVEGPFESREEAQEFGNAEVGVTWRVRRTTMGEWEGMRLAVRAAYAKADRA